jgi:hypothetical protein
MTDEERGQDHKITYLPSQLIFVSTSTGTPLTLVRGIVGAIGVLSARHAVSPNALGSFCVLLGHLLLTEELLLLLVALLGVLDGALER